MPLYLVKARLLPGKAEALDAFLASPSADAGTAKALKEALAQAHWSGPIVYLPVESADAGRAVREVLGSYLEVQAVTPIEQVAGVVDDDEEAVRPRAPKPKKPSAPRKSAASEED